jgi:hypothetical protein
MQFFVPPLAGSCRSPISSTADPHRQPPSHAAPHHRPPPPAPSPAAPRRRPPEPDPSSVVLCATRSLLVADPHLHLLHRRPSPPPPPSSTPPPPAPLPCDPSPPPTRPHLTPTPNSTSWCGCASSSPTSTSRSTSGRSTLQTRVGCLNSSCFATALLLLHGVPAQVFDETPDLSGGGL